MLLTLSQPSIPSVNISFFKILFYQRQHHGEDMDISSLYKVEPNLANFKWCVLLAYCVPCKTFPCTCTFSLLSRFYQPALNSHNHTCGRLWILKSVACSSSLSPTLHFKYLTLGFIANATVSLQEVWGWPI